MGTAVYYSETEGDEQIGNHVIMIQFTVLQFTESAISNNMMSVGLWLTPFGDVTLGDKKSLQ